MNATAIRLGVLLAVVLAWPDAAHPAMLRCEAAPVVVQATSVTPSWTSVSFLEPFDTTPLVFSLATNEGSQVSALRIRNVTTTGFEIVMVEPSNMDGRHVAMSTAYFAIEPGVAALPDGTVFEAGWIDTTTTVQKTPVFPSAGGFESVTFASDFGTSTPALLAQIQTTANEAGSPAPPLAGSTPWLTASVRNVTSTGVQLSLGRAEVNDNADGDGDPNNDVSLPERLGYVAVSHGAGSFTPRGGTEILYDVLRSPDVITGWDNNGATVGFTQSFPTAPLTVGTIATRDGGDGGWLRRGR